jgi:hypothetical protein
MLFLQSRMSLKSSFYLCSPREWPQLAGTCRRNYYDNKYKINFWYVRLGRHVLGLGYIASLVWILIFSWRFWTKLRIHWNHDSKFRC